MESYLEENYPAADELTIESFSIGLLENAREVAVKYTQLWRTKNVSNNTSHDKVDLID